jgi:hypothetical protein
MLSHVTQALKWTHKTKIQRALRIVLSGYGGPMSTSEPGVGGGEGLIRHEDKKGERKKISR